MGSYYEKVTGNLIPGTIADVYDIEHIQTNISDMANNIISDLHDKESYVLGTGNTYKNSFILTPAKKKEGRYLDSYNIPQNNEIDKTKFFNINKYTIKQPIVKTKTSLYSIITYFRNTSDFDIEVKCRIENEFGEVLSRNTVTIVPEKEDADPKYEIIFDINYCPTVLNLDFEDIIKEGGQNIAVDTKEESFDVQQILDESIPSSSIGASKLYFIIEKVGKNALDLRTDEKDTRQFDAETSLGVYYNDTSLFTDREFYASAVTENIGESKLNGNIFYKDVYTNENTYLCSGGSSVINGEKISCLDSHISIEGSDSRGNTLTQVYLGIDGHLHYANTRTSFTTNIEDFEDNLDDPLPPSYLPIALILTYSNSLYDMTKEPLIIQDTNYGQLPPSHHERLRLLENKIIWDEDISLPSRIKATYSDGDWIDENAENLNNLPQTKEAENETSNKVETLSNDNIFTTIDEKGNPIVKLSDAVTKTISITLKEKLKNSDGTEITLKDTDVKNASSFATITHMVHDSQNGTLTLGKDTTKTDKTLTGISTTSKQAKLTKLNPWDDSDKNRPRSSNVEKITREYKVIKDSNNEESYYPGMTFYTDTNYKVTKLNIPVQKFQNCSGVKFFIFKRADTNTQDIQASMFSKTTKKLLKKVIYKSKEFSLKKAKVKGKYQYMENGFTLNFGDKGLSLEKGQYVIMVIAVPKSKTGSLFIDTYKKENGKDFCLRYKGTADGSFFKKADLYQEIWYNSPEMVAEAQNYYTTGTVISKTLTFTGANSEEVITSVKPIVRGHLTLGNTSKDKYELYVNTGGKWIKVTPGEDNPVSGGAKTFKWKLVFKGDGTSTPKLAYNSKHGYAIKFILTRAKPGSYLNTEANTNINKNMCITSKSFDANDILTNYIGDSNLDKNNSRFEEYEFARIWADKELNKKLLIDIQASDKSIDYELTKKVNNETTKYSESTDLWSLHYCDLTLDDFDQTNVDYDDYVSTVEYDENNLRLKLDSENSYNDNDIKPSELYNFVKQSNEIDSSSAEEADGKSTATNKETVTENQLFIKKTFENPIDLTKYTGLKFKFALDAKQTSSVALNGMGIYISTIEETEVPSDIKYRPDNLYTVLTDEDVVPEIIDPEVSSASYYDGKIFAITHTFSENDGTKAYKTGYYKYVEKYDESLGRYIYKREQVFDLRTFNLYKIDTINYFDDEKTFEVRIELNQESNNLKHVKEIGVISLNDEDKFKVQATSIDSKLSVACEQQGTLKIYLKDKDGNPLIGKLIHSEDVEDKTTDGEGKVTYQNIVNRTYRFEYSGDIIEENGEKKAYTGTILDVECDFAEPSISLTDKTVDYDENISADYTKDTTLTIVKGTDNKSIKVTLKSDNIGLKGQTIHCGNKSAQTDNNGIVTFSLSGQNEVDVIFNAKVVTDSNNKKTLYKPSGKTVSYDFRTPSERVTSTETPTISVDEISFSLQEVKAINEDYVSIYDPTSYKDDVKLKLKVGNISGVTIHEYDDILLNSSTYESSNTINDASYTSIKKLIPNVTQININHKNNEFNTGEKILCYINNPFENGLSRYKHIGIQIASDVYIPKDSLVVDICSETNGQNPIASVNLPTLNTIYYPQSSQEYISLNQIFKKINLEDKVIKSICIRTTENFYPFINSIVKSSKPSINIFLGKIVLYKARTIPVFHKKMRFKFYSTTNGKIDHYGKQISQDSIEIRKIGAVLDYH